MKPLILLAVGSMFLWGCTDASEKTNANHETLTQGESEHVHGAIELNGGEKWMVNEEMKPFVLKGEELVNTYVQTSQTDYKLLAEQVKEQDNELVKSCTMDGKSHDELHKWLHPHMLLVEQLETTEDANTAQETVTQLQASYQSYHQYFN